MIPSDCARISITADLTCFGFIAAQVHGYAYALDNQPILDVVTLVTDDGEEIEMAGPYGTPMEDAIREALWREARSVINASRLTEAFIEWETGGREDGQERAFELRVVAAE